jgi:4'-phosphopantetheinyl transferase
LAENAAVHVLSARLDVAAARRGSLRATLSRDERERAGRFRFDVHRDRFVVARGLLREILGAFLGVSPARLAFEYGPHGKPSLAAPFAAEDLRFNVSHAGGLALYAVTRGAEVGVDVEAVGELPGAEDIAARFFSAREQADLLSLGPARRTEAFFACWTRKEAFLKATGDGLARPLDSFDVSLVPGLPARLERVEGEPREAGRWSLAEVRPAPGLVGAVAVAAGRACLPCREWLPVEEEMGQVPLPRAGVGHPLEAR